MDKIIIGGTEYDLEQTEWPPIVNRTTPIVNIGNVFYVGKAIPKEVPKPDYEILECIMHGDYPHKYINRCLTKENPCKIHSVKRLSDNSIWTIGDNTEQGTIKGFQQGIGEWDKEIFAEFSNGETGCRLNINYLKKVPERKPLFYADNGLTPICGGDKFWLVSETQFYLIPQTANFDNMPYHADKKFSSLQLANEYLLMNKPTLSLNELLSVWDSDNDNPPEYYKDAPLFLKFKELAKKKIKL